MLRPRYGRWAAAFILALVLRTLLFTTPNNVQGGGFMMTTHLLFTFLIKIAIDGILDHKTDPEMEYKRLPLWSWIVAALFFPSGFFLAYGYARLLRWRQAAFFAAFSYAGLIVFVSMMQELERNQGGEFFQSILSLVFVGVLSAWGKFLHLIGERANYWSTAAQKMWRRASWFGIFLAALAALSVLVQIVF